MMNKCGMGVKGILMGLGRAGSATDSWGRWDGRKAREETDPSALPWNPGWGIGGEKTSGYRPSRLSG